MTSAFRRIITLCCQGLMYGGLEIGLIVVLGSLYTQFMMGLILGFVLMAIAVILSRLM